MVEVEVEMYFELGWGLGEVEGGIEG